MQNLFFKCILSSFIAQTRELNTYKIHILIVSKVFTFYTHRLSDAYRLHLLRKKQKKKKIEQNKNVSNQSN